MQIKKKHVNTESGNSIIYVLMDKSFRALWFGQIFSQTAANSLLFILALRLYQVSQSNTVVSGLFLVYGIPALLFGLMAGVIVDKFENKYILIIADVLRAIIVMLFFFLPHYYVLIYVLTFFNSIIGQFYVPAQAPTIPYIFKNKYLVTANGIFAFSFFSTIAVGSILSGPLLKFFGSNNVFIFISFMFLTASIIETNIKKTEKKVIVNADLARYTFKYSVARMMANIKEAILSVKNNHALRDGLILLVSTQTVIMILGTLGPGFADKYIGIDVRDTSLIIMAPAVIGLITGAIWVSTLGYKLSKTILIRTGLITAGMSLIIITVTPPVLKIFFHNIFISNINLSIFNMILFYILGFANSMLDIPANSILQEKTEESIRGRIYGILSATVGGIGIIPVVFGGIIADLIGTEKVIFGLGLIIILSVFARDFFKLK
jgi:MFS family permease